jgi:hypothetical protein
MDWRRPESSVVQSSSKSSLGAILAMDSGGPAYAATGKTEMVRRGKDS